MADAKATTSAVDFLGALACQPEAFEAEGVTVELRGLTLVEVQNLSQQYANDSTEMAFQALRLGLVTPQLSAAQFEQARNVKAGPLMQMAKRVMELSGLAESSVPLAGSGS